MKRHAILFLGVLALAACDPDQRIAKPAPAPYDAAAKAQFCGMTLGEHQGPKGQIWVKDQTKPLWFTSVHDIIAFTLLPEEPKDIVAIYVTDMAKASSWAHAETGGWIDADSTYFVIESGIRDDMGATEEVPFSDRTAADKYARDHGGRVVAFDAIPKDKILDEDAAATGTGN